MFDGTLTLFEISNYKMFPDAAFRYIMWLHQILPVIAAKTGFSLKTIMFSYVVNDSFYYVVVYIYAWFRFRSIVLSLSIIFLHLLTTPINFYLMVAELLPGAVLIPIIIWAIQPSKKRKPVKFFEIFILVALVTFSHPLITVTLIIVLLFIAIHRQWYLIQGFLKRKRIWAVISSILFWFGIRYWLITGYEKNIIDTPDYSYIETLWIIITNPSIAFNLLKYYLLPSPAITIIIIATITGLVYFKRYLSLGLLLLCCFLYGVLLVSYVDFTEWGWWLVDDVRADRWSSPIRIIFIIAFCEVLLDFLNQKRRIRMLYPALGVMVLLGFVALIRPTNLAITTVAYYKKIINQVRQNDSAKKYYYNVDKEPEDIYIMDDNYLPTLIYSSVEGADSTVHAIAVKPEEYKKIEKLSKYKVCAEKDNIISIKQLDRNYFGLIKEKYKYLDVQ